MRENRPYGSEGGESSLTGLPYPYFAVAAIAAKKINDFGSMPNSHRDVHCFKTENAVAAT